MPVAVSDTNVNRHGIPSPRCISTAVAIASRWRKAAQSTQRSEPKCALSLHDKKISAFECLTFCYIEQRCTLFHNDVTGHHEVPRQPERHQVAVALRRGRAAGLARRVHLGLGLRRAAAVGALQLAPDLQAS